MLAARRLGQGSDRTDDGPPVPFGVRLNPTTDIVPAASISAIVTEAGVLTAPFRVGARLDGDRHAARRATGPRASDRGPTTRDRDLLRAFLERDRLRAAYALCDLEDREFARTKWGVATERGEPIAVVLEYGGLTPQPLFVMGDADGISAILRDVIRPRLVYLAADRVAPARDRAHLSHRSAGRR